MFVTLVTASAPATAAAVFVLVSAWTTTPIAAQSPGSAPVAFKDASKEQKSPVAIAIGEVVKARLGESGNGAGYHYWKVAPPAGKYRVVLDVKRADDRRSNLQSEVVALRPDGSQLGKVLSTNEIDYRLRSVAEIDAARHPEFVLRVGNHRGIVDYWIGVFPATTEVAVPYFVEAPKVEPIELGKTVSAALNPTPGTPAEAWYSLKLKGADYRVSVEFTRMDGRTSSVQGDVVMFGPLGERFSRGHPTICRVNAVAVVGTCVSKLLLSDDMNVLFRVAPTNDGAYKTVFTVEPYEQP